MRMRYKKHLPERLENVKEMFLARESEEFYNTPEAERRFVTDPATAFGENRTTILEIGCGKGAFAVKYATLHPNVNYIAVEKLSNVIIAGCETAKREGVANLLFLNCGAENLLYFLPAHSVDEIILNFSCPFPKKGHAGRRLTHANFLEKYKILLKNGGKIRQKTDDRAFFEFSLEQYRQCGFEVVEITYDLHSEPKNGKIVTENKNSTEPENIVNENLTEYKNIMTEYEEKFVAQGKPICACVTKLL